MTFQKIEANELDMNIFKSIGTDWMLISAGDEKQCNTMTASWEAWSLMGRKYYNCLYSSTKIYKRIY